MVGWVEVHWFHSKIILVVVGEHINDYKCSSKMPIRLFQLKICLISDVGKQPSESAFSVGSSQQKASMYMSYASHGAGRFTQCEAQGPGAQGSQGEIPPSGVYLFDQNRKWRFPKMGAPQNHQFLDGIFHWKPEFLGTPILGNPHKQPFSIHQMY